MDGGEDGGEGNVAGAPLSGIGVLVTRPREQAAGLMGELARLGAFPILFPALAILPPRDGAALGRVIGRLDQYDWAFFISPTAAQRGIASIQGSAPWPTGLAVAALGKGTASALHTLGIVEVLEPRTGADSEHLLAMPRLQDMAGKRVVIFRGEGGRELLADILRQRGARVDYAECYRRGMPDDADPAAILELFGKGRIQAVTAYSSETLDNLLQLAGGEGRAALLRTPLFVPHPRIGRHARELGFATVVDDCTGEGHLVAALVKYFAHD